MASKATHNKAITQSPFSESRSGKLLKGSLHHDGGGGPKSQDYDVMYASPQQTHRPVFYPSSNNSQPRAQYSNSYNNTDNNGYIPQQHLASPQAVYDDPAGPHGSSIRKLHQQPGEKDNNVSLFPAMSNALYSSWIEQQEHSPTSTHQNNKNSSLDPLHQSHSSLSMASPVPQRSIWSTNGGDRGSATKSPVKPPSVYQPTTKADAGNTEDLEMARLSLSSSHNPMLMQHQRNPRGSNSSSNSSYSTNLPGLVHASSESTTSASLPTLYTNSSSHNNMNNNSDDDAANANILQSSLRSFLDDEDDNSYSASPTSLRPIVAGPPGFESHKSPSQPPRQTVGYNKMAGNSSTRRNRNRNKLRQQKKLEPHHNHQQPHPGRHAGPKNQQHQVLLQHPSMNFHKALKERNSLTNHGGNDTPLEPLLEKPYPGPGEELAPLGATATSSLKRAVAAQQHQLHNQSNDPSIHNTGSGSEALRMLLGDEPSERNASNSRQSVLDLESSYNSMNHGSSSSLRLSVSSPAVSPHTPHKQPPILPMQLPPPMSPLDYSFSTMYAQDNSTNSSEDDDDLILMQHILTSENQQLQQQGGEDAGASNELGIPDDLLDDHSPTSLGKKREWLLRMSKKLQDVPVGELDPSAVPISAIMNAWAKTKSAQGASMVEMWLKRAQQEFSAGNHRIVPTTKMYTMAGKILKCHVVVGSARQDVLRTDQCGLRIHLLLLHYQSMPGLGVANAALQPTVRKTCCTT
jgi:hypothetical protein